MWPQTSVHKLDPLPALQAVEVDRPIEGRAMEEVLDSVLGGDEPEAAVRNGFLDRPEGHHFTLAPQRAVTLGGWALCSPP